MSLKKRQFELLREVVRQDHPNLEYIVDKAENTGEITSTERSTLQDIVGDRMVEYHMDDEGELDEAGTELEQLIGSLRHFERDGEAPIDLEEQFRLMGE